MAIQTRRRGHAGAVLALVCLVVVAGCGEGVPGPSNSPVPEETADQQVDANWGDEVELTGKPRPNKPGRIKKGLHVRPGVEFAQLTPEEVERDLAVGPEGKFAYVAGPAREKLADKDGGDVFMGPGFIFLIGSEPVPTARGLKVDLRRFVLAQILWGDWALTAPVGDGDAGSVREPIPPYRTREQPLALPKIDLEFDALPWDNAGGEINIRGGIDVDLDAGLEPTFVGRIPYVHESDDYTCDEPDFVAEACAPGGFYCPVEEKFCVERIGLTASLGAGVEGDLRVDATAEYERTIPPENAPEDLADWYTNDNLPPIPIPSTPLALAPEFYAGYKAKIEAQPGIRMDVPFEARIERKIGFMYKKGRGVDFFEEGPPGPASDEQTDGIEVRGKAEVLFRIAPEMGLRWSLTSVATSGGSPVGRWWPGIISARPFPASG